MFDRGQQKATTADEVQPSLWFNYVNLSTTFLRVTKH